MNEPSPARESLGAERSFERSAELRERLRAGDRAAVEELFRDHYAALVGFADGYVRSGAVAEEIVQDVFLNLWRGRDRLAGEGTLRAYLFQAVRNRALNHLRHARHVARHAAAAPRDDSAPALGDALLVEAELAAAVRAAVDALPERCREVFLLSRGHNLSYVEIARTLEISVKTVETQMGRALKAIRRALLPYLEGRGKAP
ncbi:MAG: RNA polymerase sigma-70 factor [Gemmatimonadaceae bacterium]